ncbi:MAG: hypothetical protein EBU90_01670 [Proteobacteria bacterium]|nr:hypothetical protein [Pseudomonadota bacterium]
MSSLLADWKKFEFTDPEDTESVIIPKAEEGKFLLHACYKNAGSGKTLTLNSFSCGKITSEQGNSFLFWEDSGDQTISDYIIEPEDFYCIVDIYFPLTQILQD